MNNNIIVIGAGASGLTAAYQAAKNGANVTVLERGALAGRKILASGNGRCNISNTCIDHKDYIGASKLVSTVLNSFHSLNFFDELGIFVREEDQGRLFPVAGKSSAVLMPLMLALEEEGVKVITNCDAVSVTKNKNKFTVTCGNNSIFEAQKVVLACGSPAYPQLGGTDGGAVLAQSFGIKTRPFKKALCAFSVDEKGILRLSGSRFDVHICVIHNDNYVIADCKGELLITDYGLSGPAAQSVAGFISEFTGGKNVKVQINFFPHVQNLYEMLISLKSRYPGRKIKHFLAGFAHDGLANLAVDVLRLKKNSLVQGLDDQRIYELAKLLSAWQVSFKEFRPLNEAMVCIGGVEEDEVEPSTLETKKVKGLYVTGELLNPVGKSGGYNLHFAWASGALAGNSASRKI